MVLPKNCYVHGQQSPHLGGHAEFYRCKGVIDEKGILRTAGKNCFYYFINWQTL